MANLEWEKLLSRKRQRVSNRERQSDESSVVVRNEFESDYDRIVGSSSVRRLQDKAQVFPLQQNDVVRTRLTHSIEVSAVARSLGKAVGRRLERENKFTPDNTDELAAVLQVAGLIHDLGNPPFGHYGEDIIRKWFSDWFSAIKYSRISLSEQEKNDLLYFDGNVQNLRIVSKLQIHNDIYGANFTYATLGTIMKYPWDSVNRPNEKKKFGYFASEEKLAESVRAELGLGEKVRHPATYLLEAADDIIYLCDDIEDGVKKGCIDWVSEYDLVKENLADAFKENDPLRSLFERIDNKKVDKRLTSKEQTYSRVRNFRNAVQSYLFGCAVEEFVRRYDDIMSNDYSKVEGLELLECEKKLIKELQRVTRDNCFPCDEVLKLELYGHRVITSLLDIFIPTFIAASGKELSDTRTYAGKLFKMISPNFVYVALYSNTPDQGCSDVKKMSDLLDNLSDYQKIQLVVDFVTGMTDSYAVNLLHELTAIKHP